MPAGVFTDREKHGLGALIGERLEHALGIARPRAIVESQHDLVVTQEVVGFEVLEAEARTASGIDLNRTLDAERVRIGAGDLSGSRCWRSCWRSRRCGRILCPDSGACRRHRYCQSHRESAAHQVLHTLKWLKS